MAPYLFSIMFLSYANNFHAQNKNAKLLKSTLTTINSTTNTLAKNNILVLQSAGQKSILGTKKINKLSIQQGFLNNTRYFIINNSENSNFEKLVKFVISPNPFTDYIKINFSKKTDNPIYIKIHDVNGKTLLKEQYQASESIIISMKNYAITTYLIQIVSGENKFVTKIFKTE